MRNKKIMVYFLCVTSFFLYFRVLSAAEPIIFSTAPTHSSEKTTMMYQPLLEFLSKEIGREIILKPAVNFTEFNNKVQNDEYDFVFDGPHFVNWRMIKFDHIPLVRLPGEIRIVIIAKTDKEIESLEDFIGKRICTFPSPNLLTMIFLGNYKNPMRQPIMVPARGFKGIENCVQKASSVGVVLRDKMWSKLKNKEGLVIIDSPKRAYPERTFSISNKIAPITREKIKKALLSEEGRAAANNLLTVFKRKGLIEAKEEEYQGAAELLNPVWGYELR